MSSRLILPEDEHSAEPLVLRQVRVESLQPAAASKRADEAQPEFEAKIARLEQESERRVREAREAGLREGETTGRNRAAAELQPVIERLSRTIDELGEFRPRLRKEAEADMVKLSLAIARRVLRRELSIDPDALHGLILAALEKLQAHEVSRVKVHPSHVAAVSGCLSRSRTGQQIEVIPDPSREPGAVV